MRQDCLVLIACFMFFLCPSWGAVRCNWVGAEELSKEEVAALKELLKTKAAPGAELTAEEISALKELAKAREVPPMPAKAPAAQLTDDEVTGVRDFMTQFKGIKFNGFVESFYQYNTVDPGTGDQGTSGRRGVIAGNTMGGAFSNTRNMLEIRGFDKEDNSFTLNNIELHLYKEPTEDSPIGFRMTTLYGEIAHRLTFVPSDGRVDDDDFTVGEGYTWWKIPFGKGIDFKFGKFATWIGAEVWEAHWNPNWSRSLLYNNAIPFTHVGA
ncbi:MAG: outer membrane beta-barrel protein, partial [Candidatus Brocadiales bacterium]